MQSIINWFKTSVIPLLALCGIPGGFILLLLGVSWWVVLILLVPMGFVISIITLILIYVALGRGWGA